MNHSIGDSHSIYTFRNIEGFMPHHIGSITMHRVGRDGLAILDVGRFDVKPRDRCFFSFGEIDCRCHIHREVTEERRDLVEVVETLASRYLDALVVNARADVQFWVVSVLPPVYQQRIPAGFADDPYHARYLASGTNDQRAHYAVALNRAVRREAESHGANYLDLHRLYADEDQMLVPELSDGCYHIGDNYLVRRELTELGIV